MAMGPPGPPVCQTSRGSAGSFTNHGHAGTLSSRAAISATCWEVSASATGRLLWPRVRGQVVETANAAAIDDMAGAGIGNRLSVGARREATLFPAHIAPPRTVPLLTGPGHLVASRFNARSNA